MNGREEGWGMRRAVFRCDASATLGGGHLMRCLTLAEALRAHGWWCGFAVGAETLPLAGRLIAEASAVLVLGGEDDADGCAEAIVIGEWACGHADLLVVDHYRRDIRFERPCRLWAERILVIDDLADRPHDADIVLDQTCDRDAVAYARLVPATCRVLAGTQHALLRPAFATARPRALARRQRGEPLARVLVAFGASDPVNATVQAIRAVAASGVAVDIDVVIGAGSPHADAVRAAAAGMLLPTHVYVGASPDDVAALMAAADLAIGAGGGMAWERCCLGLPSVILEIADNQRCIADALARRGAARNLGPATTVPGDALAGVIRRLAGDADERRAMADAAARVSDGLGVRRLLGMVCSPHRQAA